MDPNAALEEIRALVACIVGEVEEVSSDDVLRLAELVQGLDRWIAGGGFFPAAWMEGSKNAVAVYKRAATLERLVEQLAEECDQRADADMQGDPPRYVPNFAMQLLTQIRAVVPR